MHGQGIWTLKLRQVDVQNDTKHSTSGRINIGQIS